MRKNNICTILFSLVICVFLVGILISSEVFGIELEQDYDADYGSFVGELYFDDMIFHSSIFCNKHGMPFFYNKKLTKLQITGYVEINGIPRGVNIDIDGEHDVFPEGTKTFYAFGPLGHYEDVGPMGCGPLGNYQLTITAIDYRGRGSKSVYAACQPESTTRFNTLQDLYVYATGVTEYTMDQGPTKEINNKISYLLAEANANTPGLKPVQSEANWAWWRRNDEVIVYDDGEFEWYTASTNPTDQEVREHFIGEAANEAVQKIQELMQELQQKQSDLTQEQATFTASAEEARSQIAQLEAEIAQLEADIQSNEIGKNMMAAYVQGDKDNIARFKAELKPLQADLKAEQKKLTTLNKEMQGMYSQISRLNSDISRLEGNVTNLDSEVASLNATLMQLEMELMNLQNSGASVNDIAAKNEEIANVQKQLQRKQNEFNSKKDIIVRKQNEIAAKENEINAKQAEIDAQQSVVNDKQTAVNDKQSELAIAEAYLKNDQKTLEQCEKNISEAKAKIEEAKSKIDTYKYILGENASGTKWQDGDNPNKVTMTAEQYKEYLQKKIEKIQQQLTELAQILSDIQSNSEVDVARIQQILNGFHQNKYADKEGYSASDQDGKLREAEIFNEMHDYLRGLGADIGPGAKVDYQKSVKDLTDLDNIKVEYDAEIQQYTIGPFKMQYLEVYASNNQFAGIIGDPVLYMMKDDQEITKKLSEGGWDFAYKKRNADGKLEDVDRKTVGTLGDQVPQQDGEKVFTDFDAVPHTDEEFYIVVEYEEGINKVTGVEFEFRCLTLEAEYETTKGIIQKYKYQITGMPFMYCPKLIPYWNGWYWEWRQCGRINGMYITVQKSRDDDIDTQPTMRVIMAERGYAELEMYEDLALHIEPGEDPGKLKIVWDIDLTTMIAGDVWVDEDEQKDNSATDGIRQPDIEKEAGINNIAVTVYLYNGTSKIGEAIAHNEDGSRTEWPVYTGGDGEWDQGHWEVLRLEAPGGGAKNFYVVEFEYDGQFLKSTTYMADDSGNQGTAQEFEQAIKDGTADKYENSSLAVEEVESRYIFDQTFGEITGDSSISGGNTEGITNPTDAEGQPNSANGDPAYANPLPSTVTSINTTDPMFNKISYKEDDREKDSEDPDVAKVRSVLESPYTDNNTDRNNPAKVTNVDDSVTEEKYKRYRMVATTFYNDTSDYGVGVSKDNFRTHLPNKDWVYIMNDKKDDDNQYIDEYMLHINLGLKERKETDMSLLKDLYKVTVVVNERKITKEFNPYGEDSTEYADFLINLENTKAEGYTLGLYSSDVAYQSYQRYCNAISKVQQIKEGTELRVFATYVIRVYNNSDTNGIEINEITDYCDGEFTLVEEDFSTSIINDDMKRENIRVAEAPYYRICEVDTANEWKSNREENLEDYSDGDTCGDLVWTADGDEGGFHVWKTTELTEKKLTTTQYAEIFSTYEVNQSGYNAMKGNHSGSISDRQNLLKEHYNIAEISSYSTYYTDEDVEPAGNYHAYQAGWISGRVDKDSAPNNIDRSDLTNEENYEDDTYQAPMLKIELRVTERDMWGTVWEDKKEESADYNIKVGDGIFSGEEMVDGVEVSLYEVINLSEVNAGGGYDGAFDGMEYYYKVPNQFYNFPSGSQNGNDGTGTVTTGSGAGGGSGNWYIYGFLAGDYTVRFDYGKNSDGNATIYKSDGSSSSEAIIKYNGQDYENTRFMGDNLGTSITVNEKDSEVTINSKFLDITGQGISTDDTCSKARDNESRRMVVDSYSRNIENERGEILRDRLASNTEYVEATQMFSETPIMQVEVEDPKIIKRDETPEGTPSNPLYVEENENITDTSYKYTIPNINFGMEQRAKTDIKLEKFIDSIYLIKSGEVIFQAKINEDGTVDTQNENSKHLGKLTYIGHQPYDGTASGTCQQGFFAIAVEDEYMDDLSLMISYKMKVSNVSEVDFTGALSRYYKPETIVEMASGTPTIDLYESGGGDLESMYEDGLSSNTTLHHLLEIQYGGSGGSLEAEVQELVETGDSYSIDATDTIRPEVIVYGKFVGRFYYENKIGEAGASYNVVDYNLKTTDAPDLADISITYPADVVVKTTVDQLIDYIDINTSLDLEENTDIEDSSWTLVRPDAEGDGSIKGLKATISDSAYKDHGRNEGSGRGIYDEKGRNFFRGENVNIAISDNEMLTKDEATGRMKYNEEKTPISLYNPSLTVELEPEDYSGSGASDAIIYITTRKNASSDIDINEMKMDNLAEILVYSNTTGRRDIDSVPGNAMAIAKKETAGEGGFWLAGFNSIDYYGKRDEYSKITGTGELEGTNELYNWTMYPENDQFAPEYVSVIPPTGTAFMTIVRNNVVQMVGMGAILIGLVGVFVVKQRRILANREKTTETETKE